MDGTGFLQTVIFLYAALIVAFVPLRIKNILVSFPVFLRVDTSFLQLAPEDVAFKKYGRMPGGKETALIASFHFKNGFDRCHFHAEQTGCSLIIGIIDAIGRKGAGILVLKQVPGTFADYAVGVQSSVTLEFTDGSIRFRVKNTCSVHLISPLAEKLLEQFHVRTGRI